MSIWVVCLAAVVVAGCSFTAVQGLPWVGGPPPLGVAMYVVTDAAVGGPDPAHPCGYLVLSGTGDHLSVMCRLYVRHQPRACTLATL
jgi:hypothetical protein